MTQYLRYLYSLRCRHPWRAAIRWLRDDGDNESNKDQLDLFLETENKRLIEVCVERRRITYAEKRRVCRVSKLQGLNYKDPLGMYGKNLCYLDVSLGINVDKDEEGTLKNIIVGRAARCSGMLPPLGRRVETALKRLIKRDNGIQALFVEDLKMSGFDKGLRHKGGWLLFDCVIAK
ncbi:hypothetical protein Tco_0573113 [Tanacetum coccineum]